MKKFLKRLLVIVLCVSVFCFPMTFSFATTSSLLPANVVSWDDVSADGKALAEAYFNLIQSGSNLQIKEMFKSMTDIPLNYFKLLSDGSWVLNPVDDIYYYLQDSQLYVNDGSLHGGGGGTRPGEEDSGHGGGGGLSRPATSSDIYIPSDDLVDFIDQQNQIAAPKGKDLFKQSYRSDTYFHSKFYSVYIPLFQDTKFSQFQDLYFIPFANNKDYSQDGVQFCSNVQYHLYFSQKDSSNVSLCLDIYKYSGEFGWLKEDSDCTVIADFPSDFPPYAFGFCCNAGGKNITFVSYSRESYNNGSHMNSWQLILNNTNSDLLYAYDGAVGYYSDFFRNYPNVYSTYGDLGYLDYGAICCESMISFTYNIDTSKIPPNQIINITGDTIYDYSITNPDTGSSTTINEYVTNNYIYPEVPSTSDPSDGAGGDVTVGGNINVGGEVGVDITVSVPDININVNQSSGAGGSGGTVPDPDDFLNGSSVDLDKYYDDAVSQASGVRSFLKQFFDFLPAELVGLICMLVAVAIVCRIFGR